MLKNLEQEQKVNPNAHQVYSYMQIQINHTSRSLEVQVEEEVLPLSRPIEWNSKLIEPVNFKYRTHKQNNRKEAMNEGKSSFACVLY